MINLASSDWYDIATTIIKSIILVYLIDRDKKAGSHRSLFGYIVFISHRAFECSLRNARYTRATTVVLCWLRFFFLEGTVRVNERVLAVSIHIDRSKMNEQEIF